MKKLVHKIIWPFYIVTTLAKETVPVRCLRPNVLIFS